MLTYTRLHPVPMCWNNMAMLTHKRLHPAPMCWNYIAMLTHKRLHPVPMCWNYMAMLTHKRLHHTLHICWNYMAMLTHKRLHPLHMCLNAHCHTYKSLCLLHICWDIYDNIYSQASVPITHVLECIWQYILTSVCIHYTRVGMYMAIYTHKRLYPLHRCWNVYGNIYSQASVPITQVLECKCQYLLTSVCTIYTCLIMYMANTYSQPLHPLYMCWNVYDNTY